MRRSITTGGAPASNARTITWTPATCSPGSASNHRPGPPSRASVARADARSAAPDSATSFGSPVEPDVAMTTAVPAGACITQGRAPTARGNTAGPPPSAAANASTSSPTRSGDPSTSISRTPQVYAISDSDLCHRSG